MSNEINLQALKGIVPESILNAYSNNIRNIGTTNIFGLACGGTIIQDETRTLSYTISGGKTPYTKVELLMDGAVYASSITIPTAGVATTFATSFPAANVSVGSHTFAIRVTDSCTPTPQVIPIGSCTMNVIAATPAQTASISTASFTTPTATSSTITHTATSNLGTTLVLWIDGVVAMGNSYSTTGTTYTTPLTYATNTAHTLQLKLSGVTTPIATYTIPAVVCSTITGSFSIT
jgi:hypothetical protein